MTRPGRTEATAGRAIAADELAPLVASLIELLAETLAPKIAAQLSAHGPGSEPPPRRRLLTLDELVALLPAGKKPATWKGWLYQRTRHGQIPGCHKIGGRLFFDPELTLPSITNGPTNAADRAGLDLCRPQSHHANPMPTDRPRSPENGR